MTCQYYLASHVYPSCTGRYCIFLDLNEDRYFSIPTDAFAPLTSAIHGWTITASVPTPAPEAIRPEHLELLDALLRRGVLRSHPHGSKAATPPIVPHPTADAPSMFEGYDRTDSPLRVSGEALYSLVYAQAQLRARPLHRIVSSILRRKSTHEAAARAADLATTLTLTARFARIRPCFPRSFLCLFDSLALIHFLACFRIYPDWVFGVREDPFFAHCWVQAGNVILNDYHDRVAQYTPIMAV